MDKFIKRCGWVMLIAMFALTGCLRSANDINPEALTPRALSTSTPTFEFPEGQVITELVTVEVTVEVEVTEFVREIITEVVIVTATPDPNVTPTETATSTSSIPTAIPSFTATVPSATPTATATFTPTPTPTSTLTNQPPTSIPSFTPTGEEFTSASVAQAAEQNQDTGGPELQQEATEEEQSGVDPLFLSATALVEQATQSVLDETATAEGPPVVVPTDPPTNEPAQQPPPTATSAPQQPQQPPVSGADCVHEVRAGENMFRLSLLYGVPIVDIASRSGVANPNIILVGQRLTIPGCGTTGAVPPPTSVPTQAFGTGGPTTDTAARAGGVIHTVSQYETLFEISLLYGVPMNDIAIANGITNPNLIIIGDQLTIP